MTPPSEQPAITAMIVAYDRLEQTLTTLERLVQCTPPPDEILAHVDGNREDIANKLRTAFPSAKIYLSKENIGPGGGRNLLLEKASNPIVASFDDDSFPQDKEFFADLWTLSEDYPEAAIFAASIAERGLPNPTDIRPKWVADFVGCGCAYRKDFFQNEVSYVPLPIAYGMEEVDFALRTHARGGRIRFSPELQVVHDTDLSHHASPAVSGYQLANTALLAFLRYPLYLLPLALWQFGHKLWDMLRRRRFRGALLGLKCVVPHLFRHRRWRDALQGQTILSFLSLRRNPHRA